MPIDRCLEIGHALASALAHLHGHDLVHRDVKPSNIIFVGGAAKLADIGLVAGVNDARSFVGTEGYIPPEGPGTPSADCYSLGKLLYELSTGHDRTAWPEPPADLAARPDREHLLELNAILHRACAPDPRQRYVNGEAMLAELELLQRGHSVRRKRSVQRCLAAITNLSLVAGLTILIAVGGFFLRQVVKKNQPGGTGRTPQLEMKGTKNREAWNAYVKGRHYFGPLNIDGQKQGIEYMKLSAKSPCNRGARGYWTKKLELFEADSDTGLGLEERAIAYVHLGQKEAAIACLEKAYQSKSGNLLRINCDARFDNLRSEPGFKVLLGRLGLER